MNPAALELVKFKSHDEARVRQAVGVLRVAFPKLRVNEYFLRNHMTPRGKLGLLALNAESEPVGVAIMTTTSNRGYVGGTELGYLGVTERRQGVGSFLLRAVEAEATAQGDKSVSLRCLSTNTGALDFYQSEENDYAILLPEFFVGAETQTLVKRLHTQTNQLAVAA